MMHSLVLVVCLMMVSGAQPEIVAQTDAGPVSVWEVERELEFMPGRERRYRDEVGISSEQTRRDVIERVALRVIAVKQASVDGLDREADVIERVRQAQRRWLNGVWRENQWGLDQSRLPSEEEIRKELKGTVPAPPDRIRLSHIYLPASNDEDRKEARRLMEQWRSEGRELEHFRQLAQAHSASQDRDRGGRMGWLHRGFLDSSLEERLFALKDGSVSSPMYFDQGMHLFFVEKVEIDRAPRLGAHIKTEMDRRLRKLLVSRRAELLRQARATLEVEIEEVEEFQWPNLRVGAQTVSGTVLEGKAGAAPDIDQEVRGWIEEELLFQSALESDWITPQMRSRVNDLRTQALHDIAAARWVLENVEEPTEASIQQLIVAEAHRFRHRLRLELRAASIPLDGAASPRVLAQTVVETVEAIKNGRLSWDGAISEFPSGTEVFQFPPATDLDLAGALGPKVFKAIAQAQPGAIRGPIQSEGQLWIVQVINRFEPGPLEKEQAEVKARKILMSRQASHLGREFGDRRLKDHHYRLTDLGRTMTGEMQTPLKEHQ